MKAGIFSCTHRVSASFEICADLNKGQPKMCWDEHSFDEQRFYDTICLVYGHALEKYPYLVQDGTLPVE